MEPKRSKDAKETASFSKPFCPYCFMQQFEVTDSSEGNVYCEVCGIDIPVRELVRL
jgi:ribosomal protein S27E